MDQEDGGSDGLPHEDQTEEEEENAMDVGDVVVTVIMGHGTVPGRHQEDDAIVNVPKGTVGRVTVVDAGGNVTFVSGDSFHPFTFRPEYLRLFEVGGEESAETKQGMGAEEDMRR